MTEPNDCTRRDFLKSTAAVSTAALAAGMGLHRAFAQGNEVLRVGLIGCGGRGTGAALNCATAHPSVRIAALGDLFADRLNGCRDRLKQLGEKCVITDDTCFVGWDNYEKVLGTDIDYVILATPPGFRPIHLESAVEAGKHIFTEKPVAVDPVGIRRVMAAGELATQKKLGIVAGTQRRHQRSYLETISRIRDGAIGDLLGGECYWNQGGLWSHQKRDEWTEMEWQVRDWLYFCWLSGDHICEQHVHNLDVMCWAFGTHPAKAYGMGGRQERTAPVFGNIYDHFAIDYEFPNGAHVLSMCRQIGNTDGRNGERVIGTKGGAWCGGNIWGETTYRHNGKEDPNPYDQEHADLIASILAGQPLNEAQQVAESTLMAIMGRMSAYTGKEVTWEQALNSGLDLSPGKYEFGDIPVRDVPIPGKTPLV